MGDRDNTVCKLLEWFSANNKKIPTPKNPSVGQPVATLRGRLPCLREDCACEAKLLGCVHVVDGLRR